MKVAPPNLALFSVKINCCVVRNGVSIADIARPNVIREFPNIHSLFGVGFKMCCYRGQTAKNKEIVHWVDVMNSRTKLFTDICLESVLHKLFETVKLGSSMDF